MSRIAFKLCIFSFLIAHNFNGQEVSMISEVEFIFSTADVEFTDEFKSKYPGADLKRTPYRFTAFFNVGNYVHFNFTNTAGLYTGAAFRNMGFISDEVLPINSEASSPEDYHKYKIIRRTYALGVPLGFKVGSFDDNFYFYAGGELDWAFHYKEKYWASHDRGGDKTNNSDWFPNQVNPIQTSLFAGVQFPEGLNLKFKYYLSEYLDSDHKGGASDHDVKNQSRYKTVNLYYFSLSWHFLENYQSFPFKKKQSK